MGRRQKKLPKKNGNISTIPSGAEAAAAVAKCKPSPPLKSMTIETAEDVAHAVKVLKLREASIQRKESSYDNEFHRSDFYFLGMHMFEASKTQDDPLMSQQFRAFVIMMNRGVRSGCLHSIFCWASLFIQQKQIYNAIPYLLEGAIRGHAGCLLKLSTDVYGKTIPRVASVLKGYWMDFLFMWNGSWIDDSAVESLKTMNYNVGRKCLVCAKKDSETVNLVKCAGCKHYFYCGGECQRIHWKDWNHGVECKQLKILKTYHKPYANEIREAVKCGDCNIIPLQKLRMELGLSRPKDEYPEFDPFDEFRGKVDHGPTFVYDQYKLLLGRKDGTVHFGISPSPMEPNCDTPTGAPMTPTTT